MKSEEQPFARAFFGIEVEKVLTEAAHATVGDNIVVVAGEHLCKSTLARAIGAHDGMYLTGVNRERQPVKNVSVPDANFEVFDV